MKKRILTLLYFSLVTVYSIQAQKYTALDSLRGSYHANRSCYDLNQYHLQLKVDPATRYLSGTNRIFCTGLSESRSLQIDLDPAFDILSIETSGGTAKWKRMGSSVVLQLPFLIQPGKKFWLDVVYRGHPHTAANPPWDGGFVWETDADGLPWIGVSCEGEGASLWFPSKDHPADEPDSVFLQYEVPRNLVAVGNGQFLGRKAISDSTYQYSYKVTYPINQYNVTFNAAAYQTWSDTVRLPVSGKVLKMHFYALREDLEKAKKQWAQAKTVLTVMGRQFGDYPFPNDGYKLIQTPYLGMEHQSCIAYGDKFDNNAFGFDFIVMHESGHEWWGNYTSANDHADLWIHESFCTYSEALYVEALQGKEKAIDYLVFQKKKIKNKSPVQGERDVYFHDWMDSDMYYKGSWMLHSLRCIVNDDVLWFDCLRSIRSQFGMKPVSSITLQKHMSAFLKRDLSPFFQQFLNSTQWPELEFRRVLKDGEGTIAFRWKTEVKDFQYPAPIFINGNPHRIETGNRWTEIAFRDPIKTIEADERLFLYRLKEVK